MIFVLFSRFRDISRLHSWSRKRQRASSTCQSLWSGSLCSTWMTSAPLCTSIHRPPPESPMMLSLWEPWLQSGEKILIVQVPSFVETAPFVILWTDVETRAAGKKTNRSRCSHPKNLRTAGSMRWRSKQPSAATASLATVMTSKSNGSSLLTKLCCTRSILSSSKRQKFKSGCGRPALNQLTLRILYRHWCQL